MNWKKAFTLTELLIALAVIGILSAVLFPVIVNIVPDKNTIMAKRAFYTTETVVSEMINDKYCYPDLTRRKNNKRIGFDDENGYDNCKGYTSTNAKSASSKFVALFTNKLDIKGNVTKEATKASFKTKDGIEWSFTALNSFDSKQNNKSAYVILTIDTNGSKKKPNCGQYLDIACKNPKEKAFDKFSMRIYETGKIQILDCWAVQAVKIEKDITNQTQTSSGCAELGEDPSPTQSTEPTEPAASYDDCTQIPSGPDDNCCNADLNPYSNWIDTDYCGNCYPKEGKSSSHECCMKWFGNPSVFGNPDENTKDMCCLYADLGTAYSESFCKKEN